MAATISLRFDERPAMVELVAISEKIEKLDKEIKDLSTKIGELEKKRSISKVKLSQIEKRNQDLHKLLEIVRVEKDKLEADFKKQESVSKILWRNCDNLKKAFQKVENKNKELEKRVQLISEKLESKEERLIFGQIAWILEEKIWNIVLPGEHKGNTAYLKTMEHWLAEDDPSKEREQARKRWADLKDRLNWEDRRHKHALKVLKITRKDDAHPPVDDFKLARKQLSESKEIANLNRDACLEIIDMVLLLER